MARNEKPEWQVIGISMKDTYYLMSVKSTITSAIPEPINVSGAELTELLRKTQCAEKLSTLEDCIGVRFPALSSFPQKDISDFIKRSA